MTKCWYCESEVSPTAKKCKHCWEWLLDTDVVSVSDSSKYTSNPKRSVSAEESSAPSKVGSFFSEYWVVLCIVWLIAFFIFKPSSQPATTNIPTQSAQEEMAAVWEYGLISNTENIQKNAQWYTLFPDKLGECAITSEKEIVKFVDAVKDAKKGSLVDWKCPTNTVDINTSTGHRTSILFDNAYTVDLNGNIDKSAPSQRMRKLGDILTNSNFPSGSSLDLIFMFTVKPNDNSEEPDGNLYHFEINSSKFTPVYVKKWSESPFYDEKRKNLIYRDFSLEVEVSEGGQLASCINNGLSDFVCYDAKSAYEKIQELYKTTYDTEDKHTNNMFIKSLVMNKNRFSSSDKDEVFIITDGEFKVWYEREVKYLAGLKQKYRAQRKHDWWADKTHNLTEFSVKNANWYQKDNKYDAFWEDAMAVFHPQLPVCSGVKVNFIGLARSTAFKPLAEKMYSKIFSPCKVSFQ